MAKRPDLATMSDAQILGYFRALIAEHRHLPKRHVLNTYGCNVLTGMIAQTCQSVGASQLAAKVTAAAGDVDSARESLELWELSRIVSASPVLAAAFDQGIEDLLDRLRTSTDSAAKSFLARWDAFIDRWGFIGPSVWEFRSPTYRTNPEIPLRMLERSRRAPDTSAPNIRSAMRTSEHDAAIAEIAGRLTNDADAQAKFMATARSAPAYLAARERSKLHCTLITEEVRVPLRELGWRLVKRGLLPRWEDVLLVNDDEAEAFVANPSAYTALIRERAARLEMLKAKEPPFVFEGEPPPLSSYKDRNSGEAALVARGHG